MIRRGYISKIIIYDPGKTGYEIRIPNSVHMWEFWTPKPQLEKYPIYSHVEFETELTDTYVKNVRRLDLKVENVEVRDSNSELQESQNS